MSDGKNENVSFEKPDGYNLFRLSLGRVIPCQNHGREEAPVQILSAAFVQCEKNHFFREEFR